MLFRLFVIRTVTALMLTALLAVAQPSAWADGAPVTQEDLRALAAELFSENAERITVAKAAGTAPATLVERDGVLIGFLASTHAVIGSVGYSGKPIDVMIAIDNNATIAGARLLSQSEPILTIGISETDIANYVGSFSNISLGSTVPADRSARTPDAITGATISSGVIRDGIIRTGRTVALAYGLMETGTHRQIERSKFVEASWNELVSTGAVSHRLITLGDVRKALQDPQYKASVSDADAEFIDIFYGLLTPPQIGQNLLGGRVYSALMSQSDAGDHNILVAANGLYSFKGTNWRKSGIFERLELHQGNRTIRLTSEGYQNVAALSAEGAPAFREIAVFRVPADSRFDPTRPWRLSFLVTSETEGNTQLSAAFPLHYALPNQFTRAVAGSGPSTEAQPLWQQNWQNRIPDIAILCIMLLVLAAILVLEDFLASRIRFYRVTRLLFLAATLIVLGWWLGAQLSVVHVIAFAQAMRTGFQWETFLLDPLIFILWSTVAISLLFWGRGVFCGWLCPFGALQELLNAAAKRIGIRQIEVPFALHERLWAIKYILFVGLFALSLHSINQAFVMAEVEPFKTTMTMKFAREWPFLAYVGGLLIAGLFVERAYCRYLCPLGAALAIPARLRMFEWLKRRPQCGRECRICALHCTVQAIHPDGHINPNECIHCLKCQTNYFDPLTCPPLKARAQRRQAISAAGAARAKVNQAESKP